MKGCGSISKFKFKPSVAAVCAVLVIFFAAAPASYTGQAVAASAGTSLIADELIPVGRAVGIKLFSDGVLVVGLSTVPDGAGGRSPAKEAGLQPGDVIMAINGKKIASTEDLKKALQSGGKVGVTFQRSGKPMKVELTPLAAEDGALKLGAWVRDSMAGIGTVTFFDPASGVFGALGHGINDVDTSALMPLACGSLVHSTIESVRRGESGAPGELKGTFDLKREFGSLYANTEYGVFGTMEQGDMDFGDPVPVAKSREIKTGKATILSNVTGDCVEEFEIEITHVYLDGAKSPRDMTIKITDKRLVDATGGIVQGMSGSPILQNGKIIGAVTHVLINEPSRGYAIFIESMLTHAAKNDTDIRNAA